MIHELRRYTIKPGKLADYVDKSGSIGRPVRGDRYGKLLGYWSWSNHVSYVAKNGQRTNLQVDSSSPVWQRDPNTGKNHDQVKC